jgi:hypothetical protein
VAQLVLTLAGGVLGGGIAGGLGQSLGALFGAYVGGILDRELFGPQEDRRPIDGARLTELNLSGSAYGQTMPVVWGRMRVPANIIWVRGIREVVRTETETVGGGGKGGGGGGGTQTVTRTSYHYYADVALGICEAPVTSIYRVWLDKTPLDPEHVDEIRTYYGDETQSPDPLIQAVEGADRTPAFRGLAYVVLENLYLTPYGNRFPNFEIEVYRGSRADMADARHLVRNVCLIPASGEWAYEPDVVRSRVRNANINSNAGRKAADFAVSIENLKREVPNVEWVSVVYAWFTSSWLSSTPSDFTARRLEASAVVRMPSSTRFWIAETAESASTQAEPFQASSAASSTTQASHPMRGIKNRQAPSSQAAM